MGKIIFWLVVFFAVLLVLRLINVANNRNRTRDGSRGQSQRNKAMIQCVDCGVYLPSIDAKSGPRGPVCGDPDCGKRRQDARR